MAANNEQIDPVCGMSVNPQNTPYQFTYHNQSYAFCSQHCLNKFEKDPQKFLNLTAKKEQASRDSLFSKQEYICPMHPEIQKNKPGNCPICGMTLEPKTIDTQEDDSEYLEMSKRFWIGLLLTVPVFLLAMTHLIPGMVHWISPDLSHLLQFILSTPVILWAGWPFFERAWHSLMNRHLNMFSLIALGVGAAYIYSVFAFLFPEALPKAFWQQGELPLYFETATIITVLVLLGQMLELKARSQTSQAIKTLYGYTAKAARLIRDGQEIDISIDQVQVGDILRVRPGDKIPVDGKVIEGRSLIDESMIT